MGNARGIDACEVAKKLNRSQAKEDNEIVETENSYSMIKQRERNFATSSLRQKGPDYSYLWKKMEAVDRKREKQKQVLYL